MTQSNDSTKPRPMNLSQLANAYGVCTKTVKKWLKIQNIPLPVSTNIFTIAQVKRIFESIGEP